MSSETFLGQIARHGVSFAVDPHEDRLTEVCAAVFDSGHCEGLARHIALGWLAAAMEDPGLAVGVRSREARDVLSDNGGDWACAVRTQLTLNTPEGKRRPDLQLDFTQVVEPPQRVLIWVEVKHGTDPHDKQLHAYVENLRRVGGAHGVVLLVAPRGSYPFDPAEIPPEVPQLTWEDTASTIATFEIAEPVGRFLVAELLAYLKEERLVDPGPLTPAYLDSLATYYDAKRSLLRACEKAADAVIGLWGEGEPGHWPERSPDPTNYWWSHSLSARDGTTIQAPEGWSLQWQLVLNARDALVDGPPGVPLLTAGLVAEPGALASFGAETLENLADGGLEVLPARIRANGWDYVVRTATLDALDLIGTDDSQENRIAGWVEGSFRAVAHLLHNTEGLTAAG